MVDINILGLLLLRPRRAAPLAPAAEEAPREVADLVNVSSVGGRARSAWAAASTT